MLLNEQVMELKEQLSEREEQQRASLARAGKRP